MERSAFDVLDFWFGSDNNPRREWFMRDHAFDRLVARRFGDLHYQAAEGRLDHWQRTPEGCLALVILLDQFPRNMFRGTPRAFSTDAAARRIAQRAIERGWDRLLPTVQRQFFYLPFEHSEDPADQRRAVELTRDLPDAERPDSAYDWARRHQEVIDRFGRFPHRNEVLGRPSTPEERDFLRQPGSAF